MKKIIQPKKINFNILLIITFFTGVIIIFASYAWFYATLDVKVDFFKMVVSDEAGLFISLDGVNYSNTIVISKENVMKNINNSYPNHTNQWASNLFPVSSNGLKSPNDSKFSVYESARIGKKPGSGSNKKYLDTKLMRENKPGPGNVFIAFDVFLKNVTGSPYPDNLFLSEGTSITYTSERSNDADGTINSLRIGFIKINSISRKSNIEEIQNLICDNKCEMVIFEPNSKNHSEASIERAAKNGIEIIDGEYYPTYGVINEGQYLELHNGHEGSNIPLDTDHFAMQQTITEEDFVNPIFQIPNGVTKFRVYVWLEGQDIDSLDTRPKGGPIMIVINFEKDLSGYSQ